ncbi:hypothetical protein [Streptomyces microflavus]|uniref:hypothetical protein n=1 Tax=Streptomyces microflavus TaxID=1919 RepID=UPI003812C966
MIQPLHALWMRYRSVLQRLDCWRDERLRRSYAEESAAKAVQRLAAAMEEWLTELRALVDQDTTLPAALVARLREDRWNDQTWLLETARLGRPQLFRVVGHRVRAAAEWSVEETAIDTTEPGRIIVLHPASAIWISVDNPHLLRERWWWGRVLVGRINQDGTLAECSYDFKQVEITVPWLRRTLPKAFKGLLESPPLEAFDQMRDPALLTEVVVGTLRDLREMADYDPQVPPELAEHLRAERWQDTYWLQKAAGMGWPLFHRAIGHRLRTAAGWKPDEATVDTSDPARVLVIPAPGREWVAAELPTIVGGRWWWGQVTAGTVGPDGTPGPVQANRRSKLLDLETLSEAVPDLFVRVGYARTDGTVYLEDDSDADQISDRAPDDDLKRNPA